MPVFVDAHVVGNEAAAIAPAGERQQSADIAADEQQRPASTAAK